MLDTLRRLANEADAKGEIKPRDPLAAFVFSIFPGLGQHYAGHIIRGITLYIVLIISSWLAAIAFMSIDSNVSKIFLGVPFVGVGLIAVDAWLCAKKQPQNYRLRWFNRTWIYAVVTLFLLFTVNPLMDLLVGTHIVRAYVATTNSMSPTILSSDLLLINKLITPGKGDLALIDFNQAEKTAGLTKVLDRQLVRRIVATAGDTVEIRSQKVFINGQLLDESYTGRDARFQPTTFGSIDQDMPATKVPEDSIFILADNRSAGLDSRVLGAIDKRLIGGKVTKVFWSWNLDDGNIKWERTAKTLQ